MARRGRIPTLYLRVARFLTPCQGYDNGKTIDEIAREIYGASDFHAKAKARQIIRGARKALGVDIFSIRPIGTPEKRYCHLTTVPEYTKAINAFEMQIEGLQKTERKLEKGKLTAEEKLKLKAARRRAEALRRI